MTEGKGGCGGKLDRERGDFPHPCGEGERKGSTSKKGDGRDALKFFRLFKKMGLQFKLKLI